MGSVSFLKKQKWQPPLPSVWHTLGHGGSLGSIPTSQSCQVAISPLTPNSLPGSHMRRKRLINPSYCKRLTWEPHILIKEGQLTGAACLGQAPISVTCQHCDSGEVTCTPHAVFGFFFPPKKGLPFLTSHEPTHTKAQNRNKCTHTR